MPRIYENEEDLSVSPAYRSSPQLPVFVLTGSFGNIEEYRAMTNSEHPEIPSGRESDEYALYLNGVYMCSSEHKGGFLQRHVVEGDALTIDRGGFLTP